MKKRVAFLGSKKLGFKCLKQMYKIKPKWLIGVITIDDRSDSRSEYNNIKAFCTHSDIPFFISKDKFQTEEILFKIKPDICYVICWYWLFNEHILKSIPQGLIGIHNSLLPKYRGGSPLVWAIINGEKKSGVSIFQISKGIDDGDIWFQREFVIKKSEYIDQILRKTENLAVSLIKGNYSKMVCKTIKPIPQKERNATYCSQRKSSDGKINWHQTQEFLYNFIRAQSKPYPGAFTIFKNKKLIIWKVKKINKIFYGTPGQIAKITKKGVYVICGDQKPLLLQTIQLDKDQIVSNKILKSINIRLK